jgi:protein-tyrosine phosphatase
VDFNFVTSRLAVGGAIGDAISAQALIATGITDIVDCQAEFDDHVLLEQPGITVLWIGVGDDGVPKPVDWFQKGIEFALTALALPHRKVYAHCAAGVNRGPSMAYAILRAWGFSGEAAMAMLKAARPVVQARYSGDADLAITALGY